MGDNVTTGGAARLAGLHQQTVIKWSANGFVDPTAPRRKYEPRRYGPRDVAALIAAKYALRCGTRRGEVAALVRRIQAGDRAAFDEFVASATSALQDVRATIATLHAEVGGDG